MDIHEALDVIKRFDSSLYEYIQNNGRALSSLQIIMYAEALQSNPDIRDKLY